MRDERAAGGPVRCGAEKPVRRAPRFGQVSDQLSFDATSCFTPSMTTPSVSSGSCMAPASHPWGQLATCRLALGRIRHMSLLVRRHRQRAGDGGGSARAGGGAKRA